MVREHHRGLGLVAVTCTAVLGVTSGCAESSAQGHRGALEAAAVRPRAPAEGAAPPVEPAASQARDEAGFEPPDEPSPAATPPRQFWRATEDTFVYWQQWTRSARRAHVRAGAVVEIEQKQPGRGCQGPWGVVAGGGYACRDDFEPTQQPPKPVPAIPKGQVLPFIYAHRAEDPAFSYAFTDVTRRDGEQMLVRPSGKALPAERYELHEVSSFQGRDLQRDPLGGPDRLPAWTVVANAPMFAEPSDTGEPQRRLAKHTPLEIRAEPADEQGHWWEIPDGLGPGMPGYMDDASSMHHLSVERRPEGVDGDELWLDIDLEQQTLAAFTGDEPVYVTLVSSGLRSRPTPSGVYRVRSKVAYDPMGSRADSPDPYFVEHVPWTMTFRKYYAIHGAYWHDVFGKRRSHGCVNLAPRDAAHLYALVHPRHEPGFFETYESSHAPGTVVRIRRGPGAVRDLRGPLP